jgi:hypothetical protein
MDHDYIIENEIIEKYIFHSLSESLEKDFQKHLFYCEKCQERLEAMRSIFDLMEQVTIEKFENEPWGGKNDLKPEELKPVVRIPVYYKIAVAASILLIIFLTFLWVDNSNKSSKIIGLNESLNSKDSKIKEQLIQIDSDNSAFNKLVDSINSITIVPSVVDIRYNILIEILNNINEIDKTIDLGPINILGSIDSLSNDVVRRPRFYQTCPTGEPVYFSFSRKISGRMEFYKKDNSFTDEVILDDASYKAYLPKKHIEGNIYYRIFVNGKVQPIYTGCFIFYEKKVESLSK